MRYLLQDILLFDSTEGVLSAVGSEESAKLPYASVLVLKVLCDNSQTLLTRNELMDRAWTENGLRASGSNLYNSLSLIRRTVLSLGIELQIIHTQPKVGLIMNVAVTLLDEPQTVENSGKSDRVEAQSADKPGDSTLSAQHEPHPLPETPLEIAVYSSEKFEQKSLYFASKKRSMIFYFAWTLFMLLLLLTIHITVSQRTHSFIFASESYYKMGEVEGCTLYRLNEESDIYPDLDVQKKIELMAKEYQVDCHNKRARFYIDSRANTHNSYNGTAQLNIICLLNKTNDTAVDCFNDFHWQQGN